MDSAGLGGLDVERGTSNPEGFCGSDFAEGGGCTENKIIKLSLLSVPAYGGQRSAVTGVAGGSDECCRDSDPDGKCQCPD